MSARKETFRLAEGKLFVYHCIKCGEYNGGGISSPFYDEHRNADPYSPHNNPCIWCGGKVVMELTGDESHGETLEEFIKNHII